jgi:ABC-type antimicrobial peptide transport system permease subunit
VVDKLNEAAASGNQPNTSTTRIITAATILALIISLPAIIVTVVLFYVVKLNLTFTVIASVVTLFLAMGFGYKYSKRISKIQN